MDKSRYEIFPGIWADCRRVLFLEKQKILALADLHLGYSWAHRFNGQMLPLENGHPGAKLIEKMIAEYRAERVVIVGDIVHQAVPVRELQNEIQSILDLGKNCQLVLISGNHDKKLKSLLGSSDVQLRAIYSTENLHFLHGDQLPTEPLPEGTLKIIGHEHPCISLGDGVSTHAKFPCFLASADLIALPAFSPWVSGTALGSHPFMSPLAKTARFNKAIAIMGKKLLPVPFVLTKGEGGETRKRPLRSRQAFRRG